MEVLQVKGVKILDEQFYCLLRALCGLRRRGNCFLACAQNPEVCNRLIRFLAVQYPAVFCDCSWIWPHLRCEGQR